MPKESTPHPAIDYLLAAERSEPYPEDQRHRIVSEHTTSLSLARALAIGVLSRADLTKPSVDIWDPAAGSGFAGSLLLNALQAAGVEARYRGQEINEAAAAESTRRLDAFSDAEVSVGDSLARDAFQDFAADLVIIDPPWGTDWRASKAAVEARHRAGEFGFGLTSPSDSIWLFISLALEKLRPAEQGGGRVAALVNPGALSTGNVTARVRERIVDAGLLESVTRLPDGLVPSTQIPLYLLTFSNSAADTARGTAMIADLQTMFATEKRRRVMPSHAFREFESGLRTRRPGPRNRMVSTRQFVRRDARLSRMTPAGDQLSWPIRTYNDTVIDSRLLESRYGADSGVTLDEEPRQTVDLDPGRIFEEDTRELLKDLEAKAWPSQRLSSLLARTPERVTGTTEGPGERHLFVPTTRVGKVAADPSDTGASGRVLSIELADDAVHPGFLAAWLNSEQGIASRQRAIDASSTGHHYKALPSTANELMRWADELIVPVPDRQVQWTLASADEQLASFEAELRTQRASVWTSPDSVDEVLGKVAGAFDDSLTAWLKQLPYPIASALWTAGTPTSPGDKQRAYLHAWEAIVTFHATALLSVNRNDPGSSSELELAIRQQLDERHIGIERASFGTWVVIIEKTAKALRSALEGDDADEVARVRRAFGDLSRSGIERLVSTSVVKKFSEVNGKRNQWHGHGGYTSEQELEGQVESLISDLRELRGLVGSVWSQLLLVRAGSAKRGKDGLVQSAEVAVGSQTPFTTRDFRVGDLMMDGELYLVRDGSQSPVRLGQFVQLRAASRSAEFTTYFYNRTEGNRVRMVSYQYSPESEVQVDVENLRADFGKLTD